MRNETSHTVHVISCSIVDAAAPISSSPTAATAVLADVVGHFDSVAVQHCAHDSDFSPIN